MYGTSTFVIAFVLLASMAGALHLGRTIGQRLRKETNEASNEHVNALQATLLGLLALLLGFTLSLSLQRYDERSAAVVTEANAISNAYDNVRLVPEPHAEPLRGLLREYAHERVEAGRLSVVASDERGGRVDRAHHLQREIVGLAGAIPTETMSAPLKAYFLTSLDGAFDAYSMREAGLERHVPEPVLWLLFLTFVASGGVVGYSMGLNGARTLAATHILVVLIVVLVFIIIDLDRPRRGLVLVDQQSMVDLEAGMETQATPR